MIKALLVTQDHRKIKEASDILEASEKRYRESKQKKWIIMVVGLILGGLLGYFGTEFAYRATKATYDRKNIDNILDSMFG